MTMSLNPVKHKLRYSQVFATEMNQLTFNSPELFQINVTKSCSIAINFKTYPHQVYLVVISDSKFSVEILSEHSSHSRKERLQNSSIQPKTLHSLVICIHLSLNFLLIEKPSTSQ